MDTITIQVEPRSILGKKVKTLRRQGVTPVHLYGKAADPLTLQAETALLRRVVAQAGENIPVSVSVKGSPEPHFAFVREVQRHPVSEALLHVDFYEVPTTEVMRVEVPIRLVGEAPAVRVGGGILLQALHALEVECLPLDVPPYIEVVISHLDDFEKAVHVSDVAVGDRVTILTDPQELIARVNPPRAVVEEKAAAPEAAEEEAAAEQPEEQPQQQET